MATIRYTGDAIAVAQVDKFTPANVEVGDIFTLTVTGLSGITHKINFTATAATVANVTAGLTAAWNASTNTLCTPITASDQTTYMDLTADVAGDAFSVASSAVNGGAADTQTLTRAVVTANAGPKDWSSTTNWSGGALPGGGAGEDVEIVGATLLYSLDQSGIANTLSSLSIRQSQIGTNPADGFNPTYLQIKATKIDVGKHYGPGTATESTPIHIDTGATASTITVYNSGTNTISTLPAIRLICNHANTNIYVRKGKVGIAFGAGETATFSNLYIDYDLQVSSDAEVYLGTGVTFTGVSQKGGICDLGSAATTVSIYAGTFSSFGSGVITTITSHGGTAILNSTGRITTLTIQNDGIVDFLRSSEARTVTTCKLDPDGKLKYDPNIVTLTNKLQPVSTSGNIIYSAA